MKLPAHFASRLRGGIALALLTFVVAGSTVRARAANPPDAMSRVQLIEWQGTVEIERAGTTHWLPAPAQADLAIGDQLRTGAASRATLQFADRSVFRLDQLSTVEILPVENDPAWKRLFLKIGALFFLDRERPARVEIRTPTATSAIRGTEFLIAVTEAGNATEVKVYDGQVSLLTALGNADATGGEVVSHSGSAAPQTRATALGSRPLRWVLHYPTVLDPRDLELSEDERALLASSLIAYESGSIRDALTRVPIDFTPRSESARGYLAALALAAGRLEPLHDLAATPLPRRPALSSLLRITAAVLGEPLAALTPDASASEWLAESYVQQIHGDIPAAHRAALQATERSPHWGAAWVRRAELEWGLGHHQATRVALDQGQTLAPRDVRAALLQGFVELDRGNVTAARGSFERAWNLDSSLGDVAAGLGLCAFRQGQAEEGLRWLQIAAVLEPQRSVLRAYLGKAYASTGEPELAAREFQLATRADPLDPTPWLYQALHEQQTLQDNRSIRSLEHSLALSGDNGVPRSRLLLDHDRAVRRADLSVSYQGAGLTEPARRAASRAVDDHPADFSAHLFRARALQALEDPSRFDLRYESARQTELLLANLLAPPQGAALSQQLSQDDHLRFFEQGGVHAASSSVYRTRGDWEHMASLFGTTGGLGYALDAQWSSLSGEGPNADHELSAVSFQAKQRLTDTQGLFLQAGWLERKGGDPSRLFDPSSAIREYHYRESSVPSVAVGYDLDWDTAGRTLLLLAHQQSHLRIHHPEPQVLFLREREGVARSLELDPFFDLDSEASLPLTALELQHLWESDHHSLIAGAAFQAGTLDSEVSLPREPDPRLIRDVSQARYSNTRAYAYHTYRVTDRLRLTGGFSVEAGVAPANPDWPPLDHHERSFFALSPKLGILFEPWTGGTWRAAWTRGLGAYEFASGLRLEPTEVAGFLQSHRSLMGTSLAPGFPAEDQEMFGLGFDQRWATGTYAGFELTERSAQGERSLGVL
ncbi:MAG: FecR domain-containing protein, partial [Verrucomicrobiales bacterium]|nr:FecR domain-containing protein [Verrucomicrobiales bacterium]